MKNLIGIFLLIIAIPSSASRLSRVKEKILPKLIPDLTANNFKLTDSVFIRIFKEERVLELWKKKQDRKNYELYKTYPICSFSGGLGPKIKIGDSMSPEGFYFVNQGRLNPFSRFHLSFNIGFPNSYDRSHGRTGKYLMVHGNCVSIGCYAMGDSAIEEIYILVEQALKLHNIVRVHIFPFRMTAANMQKHNAPKWRSFWENLQVGYQWFEEKKRPPNVKVQQRRYVFNEGVL